MVASRLLMNVVEKQQQEWHSITATANTGHQGMMMELSIFRRELQGMKAMMVMRSNNNGNNNNSSDSNTGQHHSKKKMKDG